MNKIISTIIVLIVSQNLLSCKNPKALKGLMQSSRGLIQPAIMIIKIRRINDSIARLNTNEEAIAGDKKLELKEYKNAILDYDQ
jgi:hypothetical protein